MKRTSTTGAHDHSSNHRDEIEKSEKCGCFYCLVIFPPSRIEEWIDEIDDQGTTALCPSCGIDSVIGDKSDFPITKDFLETMQKAWF